MATFTVELQHLIPNICFVTVEAETPEEAAKAALHEDTDNWKLCWDAADSDCVTGMWRGTREYMTGTEVPGDQWGVPVMPQIETIAAALALDSDGRRAVYFALEKALNYFPCVILQAEDVLDETREGLEDEGAEPYEKALASTLTLEQARLAAGSVAEDDWSDTVGEAQWRARQRLLKIARADLPEPPADLTPAG